MTKNSHSPFPFFCWSLFWKGLLFFQTLLSTFLGRFWRQRYEFEQRNKNDFYAQSWRQLNPSQKADVAFEVSSEGEFEQIRYLLTILLKEKKKIEFIYCSESVEKTALQWCASFPDQMRALRLPLVSRQLSLHQWITASHLILCRYDFFPAIMVYGLQKHITFHLLLATTKNKPFRGLTGLFWKNLYRSFDKIVASTSRDQRELALHFHVPEYQVRVWDFRIQSIQYRLKQRLQKLSTSSSFPYLEALYQLFDRSQRILLGSFWDHEVGLFSKDFIEAICAKRCLVLIAPHQLDSTSLKNLTQQLQSLSLPLYLLGAQDQNQESFSSFLLSFQQRPGLCIILEKGILCELYADVGSVYVGGGFGRSIHSVLEPLVAGSLVFVGPKIHRSTEYELGKEWASDRLFSFLTPQDFYSLWDFLSKEERALIKAWNQDFLPQKVSAEEIIDWVFSEKDC
jgi:3-deoxy-D-manno-octulosonic-acid transferase